ncbi:MAG: cytochrome ubiquinol oxidase subunit I [Acidimicrobiales bacterium]
MGEHGGMNPAALLSVSNALTPARNQMALSLGWHIILACFGMALPAMIFVQHRRGLRGDADALELAKRWSKVGAVLFAVGAVSGTILSFELGLLWPGLMERFGDVVGLAFALEGISFFTEAIFLGIYVYGWGRLPGRVHSLMLVPIMAAGVIGSFMVVSVNAWMNAPTGFRIDESGEVVDVDPIAAIFNDHVWLQAAHMYLAAIMVVGFTMSAVYAVRMLRGHTDRLQRLGAIVPFVFAAIATPLQPVVGHFAAQRIADDQPIKLAAIEVLEESEVSAPLRIGGVVIDGELRGAIEIPIPGLLSFLAQNDFDAEVIGLDTVPADERPPVGIVHLAYTLMIGIGTSLVVFVGWALLRLRAARRRGLPHPWTHLFESRRFLRAMVVAGPAAIVALETGWITTEVGRQPWIVHGVLRTEDAVTDAGYIWVTLAVLVVVYAGMTVATLATIFSMSRRWAAGEKDLATPYGPAGELGIAEDDS